MTAGRSPRVLLDLDGRAVCAHRRGPDDGGTGPPIVLAAGGAGEGTDGAWGPSLEALLARIGPVVTYDRAGSGRSDGPAHGTVVGMAEELGQVVDALDVREPAVVVGWSLGSFVALGHALRRPDAVAGLVFVDPAPVEPPPSTWALRLVHGVTVPVMQVVGPASRVGLFSGRLGEHLAGLMASVDGTPAATEQALRLLRDPDVLAGQLAMMRLVPGYARELDAALASGSLPDVPATVISAGRRPGFPDEYVANIAASHVRLAGRFPRGRVVTADRAGHQVPVDDPDVVVDAVRAVLASS